MNKGKRIVLEGYAPSTTCPGCDGPKGIERILCVRCDYRATADTEAYIERLEFDRKHGAIYALLTMGKGNK